ncbi:MAG TPA: sialidase family protein [Methylomirabilota bacterium]|nr:sialidase family protein [Methylomirabilota bacterium]
MSECQNAALSRRMRAALRAAAVGGALLLVGAVAGRATAQTPDLTVDVSQTPGNSRQPHMALDAAGTLHVAWADDSNGVFQILYKRSIDQGRTFSAAIQLSAGLEASLRPRLAVSGGAVYVVWMQDPDHAPGSNAKEIMFARSLDGGQSFRLPVNLSNTPGHSQEARVAVNGAGTVFVVWDEGWPTRHVALRRSTDGGASFEAERTVAPIATPPGCPAGGVGNCDTIYPGIAVDRVQGSVYVVWHDRVGTQPQVLFSRSLDGGATFSTPLNVSNAPIHAHCASITVGFSGRILVAYESRKDLTDHKHNATFVQSTDGGASFSAPVNLSNSPAWAFSDYPWAVESPSGVIAVGWEDNSAGGELDAVGAVSTDGGATFGAPINLSNNPESTSTEVVTLFGPDSSFYAIWEDYQNGSAEIFLRRAGGGTPPPSPPPPPPPSPPPPPPPPVTLSPTMTSPAAGTTLSRSEPVTLAWTPVDGVAAYGVEYTGPNRQFANPNGTTLDPVNGLGGAGGGFVVAGTSFTVVLGTGIPAGTYQVRVIAIGPTGGLLGHFSDAVTVTVPPVPSPDSPPPARPTITSPRNGGTLSRTGQTTFAWTPVAGAATYGFEYTGPNRQFANPNGEGPDPVNGYGGVGGGFLVSGTSFTVVLGSAVPAGSYQVRVMAIGIIGQPLGGFSDAVTVTVPGGASSTPSPPGPPPHPPGDDDAG